MENPQFREVIEAQGVTFWLPKRKHKAIKIIGLVLLFFSSIPMIFAYNFCIDPFQEYLETGEIFMLIFSIFGLIPLFITVGMVLLGLLLIFFGIQARLRITHEKVEAREYLGFFRKTWSYPRADIQSIAKQHGTQLNRVTNTKSKMDFVVISLSIKDNPRGGMLAPGYPAAVIDPLLQRLGEELSIPVEAELENPPAAEHDDAQNSDDSVSTEPIPDQPEGSLIEYEDRPEGLAVRIPPVGIRRGSKGMFTFSIIWNLLTFFIVGFLIYEAVVKGDDEALVAVAVMSIFMLVGVGTMLASINMGKRNADILVLPNEVVIKRRNIFGEKILQHNLDQVTGFHVGPSGMEVNNVKVMELKIDLSGSKAVGMLSQLTDPELQWLAALLDKKRASFR